jgi:hypothetical protein
MLSFGGISDSWHLGFENNLKIIDMETDFENICSL